MPEQQTPGKKGLRHYAPPPKDFDPFAATEEDMKRYGLPLRPDPRAKPALAALWERQAARYRGFDHLEPRPDTTTAAKKFTPALGLDPVFSCGFSLDSLDDPFIALFVTWTVPDLTFSPNPFGPLDHFHTFVGLGFLDVHVEMTVDSGQNVTSKLWAQDVGYINLQVRPGDVMSGSLCLQTNTAGTAYYFLANETSFQTINFVVDTGFPPAVNINAGVTRGDYTPPIDPLASFGVVYFDEIRAATENGNQLLTSGDAITMVDQNGATLASPVILNEYAFKAVCAT